MSRAPWKDFEVAVGHVMGDAAGCQVKTGRNSAASGRQSDSDLWWTDDDGRQWPGVKGLTVECKDVKNRAVPTWLGQAAEAAEQDGNDWFCVVHKVRKKSVGEADVFVPRGLLADYLVRGVPHPDGYSVRDYVSLSLDAFVEVWW